jgi:hypothetical protein
MQVVPVRTFRLEYIKESKPRPKRTVELHSSITLISIHLRLRRLFSALSSIYYFTYFYFQLIQQPKWFASLSLLLFLVSRSSVAVTVHLMRIMLTHCHLVAVSAMAVLTPNNAGAKDVGNGKGQQFTTGGCVSDADCRSACCAEISGSGLGICSAVGAQHQNGKLGCGFTDPNAAVRGLSLLVLCNFANSISGCHRCCPGPG